MLHVGSLMELVETGRSECQSQGMAAFLRPLISRGELQVVAEYMFGAADAADARLIRSCLIASIASSRLARWIVPLRGGLWSGSWSCVTGCVFNWKRSRRLSTCSGDTCATPLFRERRPG